MSAFKTEATISTFGGKLLKLSHKSTQTKTDMSLNIYLPKSYESSTTHTIPVLIYLSGLTCTPNNASEKAYWQPQADKHGFAVVFPDTSPRGAGCPNEDDSWDFGTGAGFYVDAVKDEYKDNYRMYSYVHEEIQPLLQEQFEKLDFSRVSITGHSMGGYGALSGFFKNPGKYKSVSAFAPICNPSLCQWGQKNFNGYLGEDESIWSQYDPTLLIKNYQGSTDSKILIHVGKNDPFYYRDAQLLPENLLKASEGTGFHDKIDLKLVDGFDHSYYFISAFVEEHANHHAKYLGLV